MRALNAWNDCRGFVRLSRDNEQDVWLRAEFPLGETKITEQLTQISHNSAPIEFAPQPQPQPKSI